MDWESVARTQYVHCKTQRVEGGAGTDHCRRGRAREQFALEAQQSRKYFTEQVGLQQPTVILIGFKKNKDTCSSRLFLKNICF